jgi:glycosyltransferase involved in cell wall biosynthesis
MTKLCILIPTYKRSKIFGHTLNSLFATIDRSPFDVYIFVGVLDREIETRSICEQREIDFWIGRDFSNVKYYIPTYFNSNLGKAKCLNDLLNYCHDMDYIITMDNDIVLYHSWLHIVEAAISTTKEISLDWDFFTFAGRNCFMSQPDNLQEMTYVANYPYKYRNYKIRFAAAQGGGMVLYKPEFLDKNPFQSTTPDAVYLNEDASHCRATTKRYVMYYDEYWIQHDPYKDMYPEYKEYYRRKEQQIEDGNYVFLERWDELP